MSKGEEVKKDLIYSRKQEYDNSINVQNKYKKTITYFENET